MPVTSILARLRALVSSRRGRHDVVIAPGQCAVLGDLPASISDEQRATRSCLQPGSPTEFHGDWYTLTYLDVATAINEGAFASPEEHYRSLGIAEQRNPNPFFRESWYLERNPDVRAAIDRGELQAGFDHYRRNGHAEHRLPNDLSVDEIAYVAAHPEVAASLARGQFSSAQEHYCLSGCINGFDPHAAFSEAWYLEVHPEVARDVAQGRWLCGYQHFLEVGHADGCKPHPLYDELSYLRLHPDVASEVRLGRWLSGFHQLIHEGLRQGRRWQCEHPEGALLDAVERHSTVELNEFLAAGDHLDFSCEGHPEVSVVIVLFGRAELTLACLRALLASHGVGLQLIIVDNGSEDRTAALLDRIRGATIIRAGRNLGFLRGVNLGAQQAEAPVLLFLNNDAVVAHDAVAAALRRLRSEDGAAAVGGRVLRLDGRLQEAGCEVSPQGVPIPFGGGDDPSIGCYLFPRTVDYCSGVFLMVRRDAFRQLRGFDPRYEPAYYEDVDLCFRLRELGGDTWYEPGALIRHVGSASVNEPWRVHALVRRNRSVLRHQHRDALDDLSHRRQLDVLSRIDRRRVPARVLYIDDLLPAATEGAGAPRALEILRALSDLGVFVTYFCAGAGPWDPLAEARVRRLPRVEIVTHLGMGFFEQFWASRVESYDHVIVARPHNLDCWVREGYRGPSSQLVYDAEALVGIRKQLQASVLGRESVHAPEYGLEWELDLAANAGCIWAASVAEHDLLRSRGLRSHLVMHAVEVRPGPDDPSERRGIVFVGRLSEPGTPNVDGLTWFLEQVLPRIRHRMGAPVPVEIVGRLGAAELPTPAGVTYHGAVEAIADMLARARVAIAPLRFGAGHPFKVIHAAAHGLPVVASPLALQQLGWTHNLEIIDGTDDPEVFARRTCALLEEEAQWRHVREGAIARVRRDYSRDRLRSAIADALGLQRREHTSDAPAEAPEIP